MNVALAKKVRTVGWRKTRTSRTAKWFGSLACSWTKILGSKRSKEKRFLQKKKKSTGFSLPFKDRVHVYGILQGLPYLMKPKQSKNLN